MSNLIKTTITLPEEILQIAKIKAVQEKTTLSNLIREGLKTRLTIDFPSKKTSSRHKKLDPLRHLGVFKLGIKEPYKKREDLYDEHIKRKMDL